MLRKTVDQVEMEITKEFRVIVLDYQDYTQGGLVEFGQRL